jgi:dihydrofolate reductase
MNTDEFGQKMNSMPKYVVSTTLRDADATWTNSTVIRDDVPGQVARVKGTLAGDILVAGSAQLARTLAALGLVDDTTVAENASVNGAVVLVKCPVVGRGCLGGRPGRAGHGQPL